MRDFAPEDRTEPDFEDNAGLLIGSEKGGAQNTGSLFRSGRKLWSKCARPGRGEKRRSERYYR